MFNGIYLLLSLTLAGFRSGSQKMFQLVPSLKKVVFQNDKIYAVAKLNEF